MKSNIAHYLLVFFALGSALAFYILAGKLEAIPENQIASTNKHSARHKEQITSVNIGSSGDDKIINTDNGTASQTTNIEQQEKRVENTLKQLESKNLSKKISAILTLTRSSPNDALNILYQKLDVINDEPGTEIILTLGIAALANKPEVLTNDDLIYMYARSENGEVKEKAARVLSQRGDDSLLGDHIREIEDRMQNASDQDRVRDIVELGNLQSKLAIPAIVSNLNSENEFIRIKALSAISKSGNEEEVEIVRPLFQDKSTAVRERAEDVLDILQKRGMRKPASTDTQKALTPQIEYGVVLKQQ